MVKHSDCIKRGLKEATALLLDQMEKNYKGFYNMNYNGRHIDYSYGSIISAFERLGIHILGVPGRKWWEIWKNDWNEKVYNALAILQKQIDEKNPSEKRQ